MVVAVPRESAALDDERGAVARAVLEVTRAVVTAEVSATPYRPPVAALPALAPVLPVARLALAAGLGPVETDVLRLLAVAELDRITHRALQRLSGDPTRPGLAVDGVATALEGLGRVQADVVRAFAAEGRLRARGLVDWCGLPGPTLTRRAMLPSRVLEHLAGGTVRAGLDEPPLVVEPVLDRAEVCDVEARDATRGDGALALLDRALPAVLAGEPIWLTGRAGTGRRTLVAVAAAAHARVTLCLDAGAALAVEPGALAALLWREVLLCNAVIVIHGAEPRVAHEGPAAAELAEHGLAIRFEVLRRAGLPVVWTSTQPPVLAELDQPPPVLRLDRAAPAAQLALWRRQLAGCGDLEAVSSRLQLPPGRAVRTAQLARQLAAAEGRRAEASDVGRAISVQVAQQVSTVGVAVRDDQRWEDVVLPAETVDSVREIVARVRHRHQVLEQWGFRAKLARGLGLAALFAGPPGTGKTMVAGLIARELGQELYQIDLSRVVSKWIGETEKNLGRVFDAAEGANVMLLFDEADALFAKRTEVKSSNDRHANAEVNYLLQRVERFEGVSILTTNLESSIDVAFKRRLAFRVEFRLPDAAEREELWRRMVPAEAGVDAAVTYGNLAERYELAGGNIRNAALRAAYLAAAEGGRITMDRLDRAVRLEYRDAGKLAAEGKIYG